MSTRTLNHFCNVHNCLDTGVPRASLFWIAWINTPATSALSHRSIIDQNDPFFQHTLVQDFVSVPCAVSYGASSCTCAKYLSTAGRLDASVMLFSHMANLQSRLIRLGEVGKID